MLTDAAIRSAKPADKPRKLADERGLYLFITPTGGKLWRLDYRHAGKRKTLALGAYPDVTLLRAREKRDEARRHLADGIDPGARKQAEKRAVATTFEAVAKEFLADRKPVWTALYHKRVKGRLERAIKAFGSTPVAAVTAAEILAVIKATPGAENARKLRVDVGSVMRYAVATGRAVHDPTAALRGALATGTTRHYPAITEPKAFGELLRALDAYGGEPVTRAALQLLPLVFVRPGELRGMRWQEVDLEGAEWRIDATRMKMKQPHIVPLSRQAVAILRELHPLTGRGDLVFPGQRSRQRPISDMALSAALVRIGYGKQHTPHGFRASARTLLDEVLGQRIDLIEHQLAHAVRDPLGRAYNRTAHLPERKKMMQRWANYCHALKAGADVVPITKARKR